MSAFRKTNSQILNFFKERVKKFLFGSITGLYLILSFFIKEPEWYSTRFPNIGLGWTTSAILALLTLLVVFYVFLFLFNFLSIAFHEFKLYLIGKIGYGNALRQLNSAFALINELKLDNKTLSLKDTKEVLSSFCTVLSNIYTEKTGHKCSVSIKILDDLIDPESNISNLEVKNIARDLGSNYRDDDKNYTDYRHTVNDNSCFKEILIKLKKREFEKLYFIDNDLPSSLGYRSSSLDAKNNSFSKKAENSVRRRRKEWYLDYQSEIVVPLILSSNPEKWPVIGYLCLDCKKGKKKIFNKEFDFPLLSGVADGIYDIVLPLTI